MKSPSALQSLLEPSIIALGYELLGCVSIPQGRHTVLRVYIDNEAGIMLADCETVSRRISAILDVEDPIKGAYTLEVSSPGTQRPLFTLAQFKRFIGERVNIKLNVPMEGRKQLKGNLIDVTEDAVTVNVDFVGEMRKLALPFTNIARANLLEPEVKPVSPKKKKRSKR